MTRRIIINADGYGFTPGINQGIYDVVKEGIISSTSCNCNFPYIEDVIKFHADFPSISIGIHFNINVGRPVSDPELVPSLLNKDGEFWGNQFVTKLLSRHIKSDELKVELRAQAAKMIDMGINLSHFDGHQNKHLYPPYFFIALEVAKEFNIHCLRSHRRYLFINNQSNRKLQLSKYYIRNPIRFISHTGGRVTTRIANIKGFKTADRLLTPAYIDDSKKYNLQSWINMFKSLPPGTTEIYCHPGYPDDILRKYATYVDERVEEVKIMLDPLLKEIIKEEKIEVISFYDL